MKKLSLIINAGGRSRRMGQDKALLPVPPRGEPLLVHILRRMRPLHPDKVLVISNHLDADHPALAQHLDQFERPVHFLPDHYARAGALGGLATGLAAMSGWSVAAACDMPLLNSSLFAQLAELTSREYDAVVPIVDGQVQPFHALYHVRCVPTLVARLQRGELRVIHVLSDLRVRWVEMEELRAWGADMRSFTNINTPQEWGEAERVLWADRSNNR